MLNLLTRRSALHLHVSLRHCGAGDSKVADRAHQGERAGPVPAGRTGAMAGIAANWRAAADPAHARAASVVRLKSARA